MITIAERFLLFISKAPFNLPGTAGF